MGTRQSVRALISDVERQSSVSEENQAMKADLSETEIQLDQASYIKALENRVSQLSVENTQMQAVISQLMQQRSNRDRLLNRLQSNEQDQQHSQNGHQKAPEQERTASAALD